MIAPLLAFMGAFQRDYGPQPKAGPRIRSGTDESRLAEAKAKRERKAQRRRDLESRAQNGHKEQDQ